jgi:hypothetical protein
LKAELKAECKLQLEFIVVKNELRQRLDEELRKCALLSFGEASAISRPRKSSHGKPGTDSFYQVDVRILQRHQSGSDRWVEVIISVDDGLPSEGLLGRFFGAIEPTCGSVVFHEDGRIETFSKE